MIEKYKVKVNGNHSIKVPRELFKEIITGTKIFNIQNNTRGFKKGDKVLFKEHTGKNFTGKEVIALIREVTKGSFTFRKLSIIHEANKIQSK